MMLQFSKYYNKLAVKITFWICVVTLPIILLIMSISNLMINNLQDKLIESYRNELIMGMTRIDSQISVIEEDIKRILYDRWTELNLGSSSNTSEVEKYQFWRELDSYRQNLDMVEFCFIKTNWNNDVAITYDLETVDYKEAEQMRKYLENKDFIDEGNQYYQYFTLENNEYLIRTNNTNTYSFGFILNVGRILSIMQNTQTPDHYVFIANKDGEIKSLKGDMEIKPESKIQNVLFNGVKTDMQIIAYPSTKTDYVLVRMIPVGELNAKIPFMGKLLRFIAFLSILVIPVIYFIIKKLVLSPLYHLNNAMHQIENGNMDYRIESKEHTEEFQHMNRVFNRMVDQIHKLTIESYEKDIEKLQIEAVNLRLAVNPHMLLNSLSMIYSLSLSKNYACIEKFTLCLAEYFRYSLHQDGKLVKLRDEMKFVNNYLRIQKIRFPNGFTYVYDIEEELFDELVPPFLIQSFVENCIKYGLKFDSEIEIIVVAKSEDDKLNISVCDTGNGMDSEILEMLRKDEPFTDRNGKHIGIWNCKRRLKMYYGDQASISISSQKGEGTQVWIQIPKQAMEGVN